MSKANLDILAMTDEDFLKLSGPPEVATAPAEAPVKEEAPVAAPAQENAQDSAEDAEEAAPEEAAAEEEPAPQEEAPPAVTAAAPPETAPEESAEDKGTSAPEPKASDVDYEAFYRRVMAPIKANGKLIQLASAEEAIQLMQMGANYTKKMQGIQTHRKFLMMLENNQLLDENKLSFLIDLDKKNPEAIKKLLKDSNIDPIDIDTTAAPNYKSGSHAVTDQEATLASAIDDLKSMDGGNETLQSITSQWDQASKKELWAHPEILSVIHTQRENGIYDRISAELERQKTLGRIPPNTPFLQAYRFIGDAMNAQGAFNDIAQPANQPPAPPVGRTPVAVRAAVSSTAKASDKVRAAAPSRVAPRKAAPAINPLAMSDEDFLKLANKV